MNEQSQGQNTSNEKLEKLKDMSKKTTEDAKEMANKAKDAAKEKLDELKNLSSEERKEMAKKVADDAAKIAGKAADAAKEKLEEFKNMTVEERKEMAKNKIMGLKQMTLKNQLKYGAVAAAVLILFISIFSSDVKASPDTVAKAACEAMQDKDYDAYVELFKPSDKEFMNADTGARQLFDAYFKNKDIDCSYVKERQTGNTKESIRFYPAKGDSIIVYLHRDGKWYVRI